MQEAPSLPLPQARESKTANYLKHHLSSGNPKMGSSTLHHGLNSPQP